MSSLPTGGERRPISLLNLPRSTEGRGLASASPVIPYESQLSFDGEWALSQGSQHFDEKSAVFASLQKIAKRLTEMEIPYAVVGGMALFHHGLRRFTEDIDILVTKTDLKRIHEQLEGLGYLPPHARSKHLRDTETGVRIEFLTTGEYPGDGKEKPVAFPDPSRIRFEKGGVNYVDLPTLIELKLASGMTNPGRLKDLSDVLELIKILKLEHSFTNQLHPYVRAKFEELFAQARKKYVTNWTSGSPLGVVRKLGDLIATEADAAPELREMLADGVFLDRILDVRRVRLATYDVEVAERYGMVDESEFWDDSSDSLD